MTGHRTVLETIYSFLRPRAQSVDISSDRCQDGYSDCRGPQNLPRLQCPTQLSPLRKRKAESWLEDSVGLYPACDPDCEAHDLFGDVLNGYATPKINRGAVPWLDSLPDPSINSDAKLSLEEVALCGTGAYHDREFGIQSSHYAPIRNNHVQSIPDRFQNQVAVGNL
ncbi:uncharacterized protein Z519_07398 [Cladophialophora bantiana CBS 173.52]|uniref:Uncharacterized protein n=1 Tax=Cladophialophora bantiana (strain ATCC 10958 / CBS 173.52 / CDC B-1940 / NIH 8579) TaxID=1442370 RepID=A0A0D2I6E4_CLAB1|nr:uncharacterized protein Z519_07398 [Cladophialophora bantiana CBS 173.52]KIW92414.1 hypothetical protein Z519_07398 [Cladophialophora bantiana CBS 173.52]